MSPRHNVRSMAKVCGACEPASQLRSDGTKHSGESGVVPTDGCAAQPHGACAAPVNVISRPVSASVALASGLTQ